MENEKILAVLESIEKYGVRYNGAVNVGEIIDLIEWQQAEIERLTEEKYKVEQNLKQCENGYGLELHTARFDMQMNREKVAKLQKQVEELKNRLAELEDKIEQGTLIELPCKVGDTVYEVVKHILPNGERITIEKRKVLEIAYISSRGVRPWIIKCWGTAFDNCDFGDSVFLTREEAEKRLEDLKK